jgi:hypothetical protein
MRFSGVIKAQARGAQTATCVAPAVDHGTLSHPALDAAGVRGGVNATCHDRNTV